MQESFFSMKIFAALILGGGGGLFVYRLAEGVTTEEGELKREGRRRMLVGLCSAAVCVLLAWRFRTPFALLFSFAVFAFLLFHSLTDIENGHIYDLPVIMMAVAGLAFRLWGGVPALADGIVGAVVGWGLVYAVRVISRGGMGSGDAMLMLGIGTFLGWRLTLIGLYCGFLASGLFVIPMLLMKKMERRDAVPLAPFLATGSLLGILAGESVCALLGFSQAWPWIV